MKTHITFLFTFLLLQVCLNAQTKSTTKFPGTPFQGSKEYCDYLKPLRYKLFIQGYNVTITKFYDQEKPNTVKGTFKNGKIYTNDPTEKQFHAGGKYYKIYVSNLAVNNLEGGDYNTFEACK